MPTPRAVVEGVAVSPDHLIGGARVPSPATFEDRSPLDWSWKLADIARGDAATAHAAVTAAVMAFRPWADLGPAGRAEHLHRLADLIVEHTDEIAIVETVDMGMLHESMRARLVARGAENFRLYADLAAGARGAGVVVEGHPQHRRADARRTGRRDHAVERPVHAVDVEAGAGAGGRQPGRAEAGRVVAAVVLAARRPDRRGRPAAGRVQPRAGHRRGGRPAARRRIPGSSGSASPARPRRPATSGGRRPRTSSRSPPSSAARAR